MQIQINNMNCCGCARAVTRAIQSCDAGAKVGMNLAAMHVSVHSYVDETAAMAALAKAGFLPKHAI